MDLQLINKYITEVLHVSDPKELKLIQERIVDAMRTASAAKKAAERARSNGNEELAQKLEARAAELETLAKEAYQDTIDSDEPNDSSSGGDDGSEEESKNGESDEEKDTDKDADSNEDSNDEQNSDDKEDSDSSNGNSEDEQAANKALAGQSDGESGEQTNSDSNDSNDDSDSSNSGDNAESDDSNDDTDSDDEEGDESSDGESDSEDDEDSEGEDSDADSDGESEDEEGEADDEENSSKGGQGGESGESGEGDDEDESENDESESDEPVKDPFADDEDIPQLNIGSPNGQEPRDATLADIIKQLKGLKGEARKGAIAGLAQIQNDRKSGGKKESLSEDLLKEAKGIRALSDDEFADLINDTLDMIDSAGEELAYDDDGESRKERVKEIEKSPSVRRELSKELSDDAVKDHKEVKARERELNRYRNCKTIDEFELNFYNTIAHEVSMVKQKKKSWNEINNEYEDEDILVKADVTKKHLEETVPIIDLYFDCSGSWTGYPEAIKIGRRAVATVKQFADDGLIQLNVYYFGRNSLSSDMYDVWGGGTHCWKLIQANIKKTGATNVVLMTDGDMEGSASWGPVVTVEGCVWFIWGLGGSVGPGYSEQGHEIPAHLIGKGNNTHYAFDVKK